MGLVTGSLPRLYTKGGACTSEPFFAGLGESVRRLACCTSTGIGLVVTSLAPGDGLIGVSLTDESHSNYKAGGGT
jgi:hypothetical protein